jgi:hypothetical protein
MPIVREQLIKTVGCYIGIFDRESAVNVVGTFDRFMRTATKEATEDQQRWPSLYHFNQQWVDCAARGELLTWIVLFDGIFKASVEVLDPSPVLVLTDWQKQQYLADEPYLLSCPSGELMVASLSDLGSRDLQPVAVVEPGMYRVALTRDDDREADHSFLESLQEYPRTSPADWRLHVQRVET